MTIPEKEHSKDTIRLQFVAYVVSVPLLKASLRAGHSTISTVTLAMRYAAP